MFKFFNFFLCLDVFKGPKSFNNLIVSEKGRFTFYLVAILCLYFVLVTINEIGVPSCLIRFLNKSKFKFMRKTKYMDHVS